MRMGAREIFWGGAGGQSVLPYDSEVEFLASTGTQWINTGAVAGQSGFEIDATVEIPQSALGYPANLFIGVGSSAYAGQGAHVGTHDGKWTILVPGVTFKDGEQAVSKTLTMKWKMTSSGTATLSSPSGDFSTISESRSSQFGPSAQWRQQEFVLFSSNRSTNQASDANTVKIYRCSIKIGGVLVRDYIPVRKNGIGYLYDKVSGELFGNQGSGAFVVGPDVTPGRLPAGYTEMQWLSTQAYGTISSGGGAYTTIPVPQAIAQSQVRVEAHAVDTDTTGTIGNWNILVDTLTGDNNPRYGMNIRRGGTEYFMCAVPGYDSYSISYTRGVPMCVVWDRGTFSVEQNGAVSSRSITAKTTASSNALNIGGTAWGVPGSTYGARFWPGLIGEITVSVSDVEIVHLVPCRNPDGMYGFYDLVGNGFYSSLTSIPFAEGSLS